MLVVVTWHNPGSNNPGHPLNAANGHPGRNFWGCGGGGGERGGLAVVMEAMESLLLHMMPHQQLSAPLEVVHFTKLLEATGGFISEHLNPDGLVLTEFICSLLSKMKMEQILVLVNNNNSL